MEIHLLATITVLGGLAGFAALLRSKTTVTLRSGVSATLNSGLLALAVGALGIHYWKLDNFWLVIGSSVLAGLGGNTAVELILTTAVFAVKTKYRLNDESNKDSLD